jgi:hypothetical protein
MSDSLMSEKKLYNSFLWAYEQLSNDQFIIVPEIYNISDPEIKQLYPIEKITTNEDQLMEFNSAFIQAETENEEFDQHTYHKYLNTLKENMTTELFSILLRNLAYHYSVSSIERDNYKEQLLRSLGYEGEFPSDYYFEH